MELATSVVLSVVVVFLFLTILGTMREVSILRGEVAAFRQLILKPPVPSFASGALPLAAARALSVLPERPKERAHALLFLAQGCGGCDDLLRKVREALRRSEIRPDDLTFVLAAASEDAGVFRAAAEVTPRVILDSTDEIFRACEVHSTPTLFIVAGSSPQVTDYVFGGDVDWIRQRVHQRSPTLSLT
jgi:hypothetical protein